MQFIDFDNGYTCGDDMEDAAKMAASMLGVSDARVRQMVCSGQLASKKRGRDNYVYLWSVKERLDNPPKPGRPKKSASDKSVGCAS